MSLLRPLLEDNIESIQQSAALALGSLASYSDDLAEEIVTYEILPKLVKFLSMPNVFKYLKFRKILKNRPLLFFGL